MISNCGKDENGKYKNGQAGDQTGNEWKIINWYNRPWTVVLRHPNRLVRQEIAALACAAAYNDNIGYDQNQRKTFWEQLKICGYDPAKITTPCEADCSAGAAAIVKAAGYRLNIVELQKVSEDSYSGNIKAVLKNAGFEVFTSSKYLTSDQYLLAGDILVYEGHHVATCVTNGSKAVDTSDQATLASAQKLIRQALRIEPGDATLADAQEELKKALLIIASSPNAGSTSGTTNSGTSSGTASNVTYYMGVPQCFSQNIKDLQHALNADGFRDADGNKLKEDGIFGAKTYQALCKVLLSVKTIYKYINVTAWVQCRVGAKPDGLFGEKETKPCVEAYQEAKGLKKDAIVGKDTLLQLVKDYV